MQTSRNAPWSMVGWSIKKLRLVRIGGTGQAVFLWRRNDDAGGSSAHGLGIDVVGAMTDMFLVLVGDRFVVAKAPSSPASEPLLASRLTSKSAAGSWAVFQRLTRQPSCLFRPLIQKARGFLRMAGL